MAFTRGNLLRGMFRNRGRFVDTASLQSNVLDLQDRVVMKHVSSDYVMVKSGVYPVDTTNGSLTITVDTATVDNWFEVFDAQSKFKKNSRECVVDIDGVTYELTKKDKSWLFVRQPNDTWEYYETGQKLKM